MAFEYYNNSHTSIEDSSSCTGSAPSGFSEGDFFIAIAYSESNDYQVHTISAPSGWTLIRQRSKSKTTWDQNVSMNISYRVAQYGDTSWLWTSVRSNRGMGVIILRYSGQSLTNPVHASGELTGDSYGALAPSVAFTDMEYGSTALQFSTTYGGSPTFPGTLTERFYYSAHYAKCRGGDKNIIGTGSTGTASFSYGSDTLYITTTVVFEAEQTFVPTINIF